MGSTSYSELVIKAPFTFVKGFLMGYMQASKNEFHYFFHRKHGIKYEGTGDIMRELLHVECHTHLCLPNDILTEFTNAITNVKHKVNVEIESIKKIKSARFTFSFHNYDENETSGYKDLFRSLPDSVEIQNFSPLELRGDSMEYGMLNRYTYEGNGTVFGEFDGIIELYLRIKRHHLADSILCSEIKLEFEQK